MGISLDAYLFVGVRIAEDNSHIVEGHPSYNDDGLIEELYNRTDNNKLLDVQSVSYCEEEIYYISYGSVLSRGVISSGELQGVSSNIEDKLAEIYKLLDSMDVHYEKENSGLILDYYFCH